MPLTLIPVAMLIFGGVVVYFGIIFLRRPEDILNKSIHYDSSTMELTNPLRRLSTVIGVLLSLLGMGIILFSVWTVIA